MKNLNSILISLSFVALVIVTASCVRRDQTKDNAPAAEMLSYPSECQGQAPNREDITIGSQLVAVRCMCAVGPTMYSWFNSVADRDPSTYCLIYPNQAVLPEPIANGNVQSYTFQTGAYTQSTQSTTTAAPTVLAPPPLPSIAPFVPLSATVAPPPVPPVPPTAKVVPSAHWQPPGNHGVAKEPQKFAPYVRDQSVRYECKEGVKAERVYTLVLAEGKKHSEQVIKQTCTGQTVGCLQGADAKNYMIPPCSCAIGEEAMVINTQGLWTCHKK
ncbi:MAG: hypothetical protein PHC70_03690 [Patescibacteria group bacterium]|nr:hypothetical protein [Patescibacteria group bacterium]